MRPGGELATRPLEFIWLADCSISMKTSGKIDALNDAIRKSIPFMREVAYENPNAQVYVRAIKFSSGAAWHIESRTPVESFEWSDLVVDGVTDLGAALLMLKEALKVSEMSERALPPVVVLISDGQPTDDYKTALASLMEEPWAVKAVKIAIAIGKSANKRILKEFCGDNGIDVLSADNAETLVEYIKWVSTVVLQAASSPASQAEQANTMGINVSIPVIDDDDDLLETISVEDVW
ncbi:MAG: tellurium resistance protein [Clostridia bacterium]|nr:tellurium resistance protein [Clostridia bacterium]